MSSTSMAIVLHQASNHDELFMNQSLRFSETLRDLKNLRKQLYLAADYFEESYEKEEHKEMVVETLKDYAVKAVVNTVDHLGSVSDKFNGFLLDNTNQFSETDVRLSCLEQRIKLCREYADQRGMYQHLLLIRSPLNHKRYVFPEESAEQLRAEYKSRSFSAGDDSLRFTNAVRATIRENPMSQVKRTGTFAFSAVSHLNNDDRKPGKRMISPLGFPLPRSGSLLRSISPRHSRKPVGAEPRRTMSVSRNLERERSVMEIDQFSNKSKRMFKALVSMRRSRNDSVVHKFFN